jgi:sterol desaturase/sphingolipid hydroxylase (fatty acid hydroxylase superfamily)
VFRLLPMSGSAEYHNFHHSHNVGNYASFFTIWDTVFGSNKYYFEYKSRKEREEYLNRLRLEYEEKKKREQCAIIQERSDDGR